MRRKIWTAIARHAAAPRDIAIPMAEGRPNLEAGRTSAVWRALHRARLGGTALMLIALATIPLATPRQARAAGPYIVNSTGDASDVAAGNGTCLTMFGDCTLRAAIEESNAFGGPDVINFSVPLLFPAAPLPGISGVVTIDGGATKTEVNGFFAGLGVNGFVFGGASGGSTIRNMVIDSWGGVGVWILAGTDGNFVLNNYIGTDSTGTSLAGNYVGVRVNSNANNVNGNIISASTLAGVELNGNSNFLRANLIGTNATGTSALANGGAGVVVAGDGNTVGGISTGTANLISGNTGDGVLVSGSGNLLDFNGIGVDITANAALANTGYGVELLGTVNYVGQPGGGNVISGNFLGGVRIAGSDNALYRNLIGVGLSLGSIGNGGSGVRIDSGLGNYVGSSYDASLANMIANNLGDGVEAAGGDFTIIGGNSIHDNALLGIDLNPDGLTFNDPGDTDTGVNGLQNFPTLTYASSSGGGTNVAATLNSLFYGDYEVQFYDNTSCDVTGYGEGETSLGSVGVSTDVLGNTGVFYFNTPAVVPVGHAITATATLGSSTSEFSLCRTVVACGGGDGDCDGFADGPHAEAPRSVERRRHEGQLHRHLEPGSTQYGRQLRGQLTTVCVGGR